MTLPADFRLRLSPSKIIVWGQCRKNAKQAITVSQSGNSNIHSVVGTAAHYVVEQINKGAQLDPTAREDLLRDTLQAECLKENVGMEFTKGYRESKETIRNYEPPAGWRLVSGEQKHVLNLGDYDFSYIIDAEWTDLATEKWLDIVDYKTSAAAPSSPLQLELYAWAEWKRTGHDPNFMRARFVMLRDGRSIPCEINRQVVERIDHYMATTSRLIIMMLQNNIEFPATSGHCFFCPVKDCSERK